MAAQAPLLVRIRPRWLQLRNQQALLLPGRSVGHISILSQTFNHIESTFRDPGSNVGIVAPTLGVAAAGPVQSRPMAGEMGSWVRTSAKRLLPVAGFRALRFQLRRPSCIHMSVSKYTLGLRRFIAAG